MGKICECMGLQCQVESFPEDSYVDVERVENILKEDKTFTTVAIVHCETSSGVFNPVEKVGKIVKEQCPGLDILYILLSLTDMGKRPSDILCLKDQ